MKLKTNTIQVKESHNTRLKVMQIMAQLPRNYTTFFVHFFPEYDNEEGKERVRRVAQTRLNDSRIITKLEQLVDLIKLS